jgi:hypothetical protein
VLFQKQRLRRNLVETMKFSGCRCCYDPDSDGTEDYRALAEYRRTEREERERLKADDNNDPEEDDEKQPTLSVDRKHPAPSGTQQLATTNNDSEDDDSEFDYLLDDVDADVEVARRTAWQLDATHRQSLQQHGYGAHRQLHPTRVLRAAGLGSVRDIEDDLVVLHLYEPDSTTCAQLDVYLEDTLAAQYVGTKFLRCDGRSCLLLDSELAHKTLGKLQVDRDVPALIAIRQGVVVATCPALQGLQDYDGNILPTQVQEWLDRAGVLSNQAPRDVCRIRPEEDALMEYLVQQQEIDRREKKEQAIYYDCGVQGCRKSFQHEHVGIQTEHQSGLVVQESEILGSETVV